MSDPTVPGPPHDPFPGPPPQQPWGTPARAKAPSTVLPTWSVVIVAAGALFFVVGLVGSASVWSEVNDGDTLLGAASRSSGAVKWTAIAPLLTVSAIGVLIMGVGLLGGRFGRD